MRQVLLFVQFEDLFEKVSEVLHEYGVDHLMIRGSASVKSKTLTQFQKGGKGGPRVLLLNVMTESAAGA